MSPTTIASLGFLLGVRHAFEPDHLAAVSTLATRQGRLWDGVRLGLAWGLGHTATVALVALVVLAAGWRLPAGFSSLAELLVAVLLVLLGLPVLVRYARGRWHMHLHAHGEAAHVHLHSHAASADHVHVHAAWDARRSLGLGLAHGLAGSAVIVVLITAAAPTAAGRAAYVIAFGLGTVAGMLGVSTALGLLVRAASRTGARWARALHLGAATASVAAGCVLALRVLG
jgi:ABC-type nickel/cobalt efflux system permease component RcnA